MATVDAIEDLTGLDKSAQLDVLRRRMATVPGGRRDHAPADLPTIAPPDRVEPLDRITPVIDDDPEPLTAAVRGKTLRTMPYLRHSPLCSHVELWPVEPPSPSPAPDRCSSPSSPKCPPPATTSPSLANRG
uniref:hypothetical protein n=1 Tax=unclassified Rhodococcus (in: high G+C Gram-positive bacteria) TaxID=192944 RepID=UPI0020CD546E|nr:MULTISPECIES: hypothetical protein [unclassified Rhodococcus (in: high G+C Gram-positive bacteria)]